MYMPGRRRTGSRPSSTVMSLASYVVLAIKKSLQVGDFYLALSVSDRTVDRALLGGRERGRGGPRDGFAEDGIFDLRGDLLRGRSRRRRRARHGPRGSLHSLGARLRKTAGSEAENGGGGRPEPLREALADRRGEVRELEGPRARARGDVQGSVARDARRPRVGRDRLAHGLGPGLDDLSDRAGRAESSQLAAQLASERLEAHGAVSATLAVPSRRTSTTWDGAEPPAGTASRLGALTSACPPGGRAARSARLRSPSSSLSTSSRRSRGGVPRSSARTPASARTSARTAVRCSPCEPNPRNSRSPARSSTSRRWGPTRRAPPPVPPSRPRGGPARRRAQRAASGAPRPRQPGRRSRGSACPRRASPSPPPPPARRPRGPRAGPAPPARRSGRVAARPACGARSPGRRRGSPPADSSCRPRSDRRRGPGRAPGRGRARRRSGSPRARPARRSAGQPDRHDQVLEVVALAVHEAGPQRADELEPHGVVDHGLEPVAQELRVETDLHRLAAVAHGERLARLADVLGLRRDGQRPLLEAQAERRLALRQQAGAAHDVEKLLAGQLHLGLELLRQELPVVGELAVDPAGRQPDAVRAEHDLVLLDADVDRLCVRGAGDARELLERTGRHDRLELAARTLRQVGLLDAQAVGVRR